jgi:hypothetical protein
MGDPGTRLSVIVPATNRPPTLATALAAIERGRDRGDEVIVIEECARPGPAAARNDGAAIATNEILVFVDADVVVGVDALERIREAFAADPALDAIFGAYDDAPADPGLVSQFRNLLHHSIHTAGAGPAVTFWAGLGAIRRARFEAIGGYDAAGYTSPSVEDIELGLRLHRSGAAIRLDPAIQGKHLKRWTLASMISTDFIKRGVPWIEMMVGGPDESLAREAPLNLGRRNQVNVAAALLLAAGLLLRRPRIAFPAALTLAALNRRLHALLYRRGGMRLLLGGFGLHVIHLLTAAAAVPLGVARGLRDRRLRRADRRPGAEPGRRAERA